jgi:NAD+ kinase
LFTLDHLNMQLTDLISVRCMVADRKVSFVRYRPFPFWNRVRESFIGDIVE